MSLTATNSIKEDDTRISCDGKKGVNLNCMNEPNESAYV